MKTYLIEYVYPKTRQIIPTYIEAKDKKKQKLHATTIF